MPVILCPMFLSGDLSLVREFLFPGNIVNSMTYRERKKDRQRHISSNQCLGLWDPSQVQVHESRPEPDSRALNAMPRAPSCATDMSRCGSSKPPPLPFEFKRLKTLAGLSSRESSARSCGQAEESNWPLTKNVKKESPGESPRESLGGPGGPPEKSPGKFLLVSVSWRLSF